MTQLKEGLKLKLQLLVITSQGVTVEMANKQQIFA